MESNLQGGYIMTSIRLKRFGVFGKFPRPALLLSLFLSAPAFAQQPLLLSQAIQGSLNNYQSIQAKRNYYNASAALVNNARNEYLPNVIAAAQQNYGTINGQYGAQAAVGVQGVSSSGPVFADQSWNAAFGSSYILSGSWEAFTFGRIRSRIKLAQSVADRDSADLVQEQFIQGVRVSGAYLNLLTAQRLLHTATANLERAEAIQNVVRARTRTGLNAGVDSSIANAEVSRARLIQIDARNNVQNLDNQLAQLLNAAPSNFIIDTNYVNQIPQELATSVTPESNPQLKYYQDRIYQGNAYTDAIRKSILPGISLFGIYQARGSGFDYNYTPQYTDRYTENYIDGVKPQRYNYVGGLSISFNIFSPWKIARQVQAQRFITKAYENEYDLLKTNLNDQLLFADQRLTNTVESAHEVPVQYKAASDAYLQKSVLYKNGLANIVDLQQALYLVNRAEADRNVAFVNVWQALLQKAAASGDFDLFLKQIR